MSRSITRPVLAGLAASSVDRTGPLRPSPPPPGSGRRRPARPHSPPSGRSRPGPGHSNGTTPARLAPLATGAGVTVAVVDSGVDRVHPQLAGRVLAGADLLDPGGDGGRDCAGHGTGVASIIAAAPRPDVAFRGLAPGARILPVRVSEQQVVRGAGVGAHGQRRRVRPGHPVGRRP